MEETELTDQKQNDKPWLFKKGQSGNPNGRPTGAEGFATKWRRAIERIGSEKGITAEQIEQELIMVGYDKAKGGDYNFYRDAMDRIHGKPMQKVESEVTQKTYIIQDGENQSNNLESDTSSTDDTTE